MIKIVFFLILFLQIATTSEGEKCLCPLVPSDSCKTYCNKLLNGISLFEYPNNFYVPGLIVSISKEDSSQNIIGQLGIINYDSTYVEKIANERFNGQSFLSYLKQGSIDTDFINVDNQKYNLKIDIREGLCKYYSDSMIKVLIKNSKLEWNKDNSYYIVQEIISSREITFYPDSVSYPDFMKLQMNLDIRDIQKSKVKNDVDKGNIIQAFPSYYGVYYKVLQIIPIYQNGNVDYYLKNVSYPVLRQQ